MALNSAYFQPFSFSDPTSPSYDPSTDEDLDWMQYAGRSAYAAKGGGRPQGAKPLPTSGSAQQKTQTALVPQPAYLNPPPSASSSAYLNNTLNVAQDYLNGVQQPNPGGGAVTSRVVGGNAGGGNQAEYLAALNALPEMQASKTAAQEIARRRAAGQAPRESDARLMQQASDMQILAAQRLQLMRPDLFKQQQPESLSADGKYVQRNGRWYRFEGAVPEPFDPKKTIRDANNVVGTLAEGPGGSAEFKPVLVPGGGIGPSPDGGRPAGVLTSSDYTDAQKTAAELEAKRQEIGWTGDQQARVAGINVAGNQSVARINSQSRVDVAGLRARDKGGMAEIENARKQVHDIENALANTERERNAANALLAKAKKDAEPEMNQLAWAQKNGDPAKIEEARKRLVAKLGTDPEADIKRHDATIAALTAKKATWEANLGRAWDRHWSNVERLSSAPSSDDGLPSPGTSGDRTDKPVPKPSQIKPPPADASSKISTTQAPDTNGGAKPRNRVLKGAKDKQGRTGTLTLAPDGVTVISFVPDGPVDGA